MAVIKRLVSESRGSLDHGWYSKASNVVLQEHKIFLSLLSIQATLLEFRRTLL